MLIRKWRTDAAYALLLLPAFVLFGLFFLVPFARSLYVSFTDQYGYNPEINFIGLANFVEAFRDATFRDALVVTLKYTGFVALAGNAFALALALVADSSRIAGKHALRAIFFLPNLMSLIIVGFVWTFLYGNVFRSFVRTLGSPEALQISWLGNPELAIYSIGIAAIWQGAGYTMIIYMAGLQNISGDVLEAARIDGATARDILWRIKLPLLSPVVVMNVILSATTCLKAFDFPLAMTSGGPGTATTTVAYYIYTLGFRSQRTGYATAVSVLLFALIALVTAGLMAALRAREEKV